MRLNTSKANTALAATLAIALFSMFAGLSGAQLGEIAGPLNYTISLGGTASLNMTIFNSGMAPLPYKVIPPFFKTPIANTTKPTVSISPSSGTLAPSQSQKILVTVTIPTQNNKPGYYWSGILQVLEVPNNTQQGVAIIEGGVAKGVNVTAQAPTFNILEVAIPAIVVIIAIVAVALWKKGVLRAGMAKKAAPVSRATTRRAATTRKAAARGRKTARKRTARKIARRPSTRSRPRRRRR